MQQLPYRKNPVERTDIRAANSRRVEVKVCRHGWPEPQELVTLTITDRRTGQKQFRQVWRTVEGQGCPDAR
jgi:hypothetical protein